MPDTARPGRLLLRLAPENVGMFRFLLEAYDNLAMFTVLERRTALLKIEYIDGNREQVLQALEDIAMTVPLRVEPWPLDGTMRHVDSLPIKME